MLIAVAPAFAGDSDDVKKNEEPKAKALSGMSIVGNDEAPKSLYIVPWKSSEIGARTSLDKIVSEDDGPVDRDVFRRQIEFYRIRAGKQTIKGD